MKTTNIVKSVLLSAMVIASPVFATASTTGTDVPADWTRKQLASALINYEAASRMQDYMRNQQLLFMSAPATIWAIQAGAVVGGSKTSITALSISDKSLLNSLGGLTKANKVTLHGVDYPISAQSTGPLTFYNQLQKFFQTGDATNLAGISMASVMQFNNLSSSDAGITQDQAQNLVNALSDPFPSLDPIIQSKVKNGQELSGDDMEKLGSKIASYAVIGVSTLALSDIIARRVPTQGQQKSVMEVMDKMAQERMTKADWYNEIGAASDTALLREIAHMMAYNQWVAYQQFRVTEQQVALLASLNAVMAKTNVMIDELNRQLLAAQAQGQGSSAELQQKLNNLPSGVTKVTP